MRDNARKVLKPIVGLVLFAGALWVLDHTLRGYHYHDILRDLQALSASRLFLAMALTLVNYLVLTGYDALAFRYIHRPLAYGKIALTSFIGYAFSQSLGLPLLTGGSVRYRLYSAWGLSTVEIAQVIAFSALTFWLGVLTVGGAALALEPVSIPAAVPLPFSTTRPLGVVFLAGTMAYVLWSVFRKKAFKIREWEFAPPSLPLSFAQIVVSSLDWALAGAVLYGLLPSATDLSYPRFLGIFLAAQVLGLLSHVPGGLGVFESVVLVFLSPHIRASAVVGSLIAYRAIYYLFPLCLSALLFGAHELLQKRERVRRVAHFFGTWVPEIAPHVFAFATFVAGMILLFSGATPAAQARLHRLDQFLPLPVLELSHFLGSLAGVGLLLLSRALQRRLDAAYHLTVILLVTGIAMSLLKGFDYEEALILAVLLVALFPCRSYFYRRASLTNEPFHWGWIAAVGLVLISSVWLTMFSYKHVVYSNELWWQFELSADAPRSLRAAAGASGFALIVALLQLLRSAPVELGLPGKDDLNNARKIIAKSTNTSAHLALLGDKSLLFSETGNAFLMYGVEGRSWISLGDPIGPDKEKAELTWKFRELSDRHDGWTVFYEVSRQDLHLYLDLGLTLLKLGEEARVPLETFSLDGRSRKGFRNLLNKMQKEDWTFEVIPPEGVPALLPQLKEISDAWLAEKNTREKGFSLGFFHPEYLRFFPAGVVRKEGTTFAFMNIWLGAENEELSLDLMRYRPDAPHGLMDYLFLSLLLWGKKEGYRWFNLGMAPLSGLEGHALAPLWNRLGAWIFRHGEHFYNFQGLRQYKEKFEPQWEPKYLASPGGLALPRIVTNIASLISGGLKGVVGK